jgi:sugar-specific transcriptional regulator TrmB
MLQSDEATGTLMDLGLTYLQAKTYLSLTKFEKAEANKIAKISDVARQDIYRIMATLENLGLVEKIIAKPISYKATPLKEGSLMLLQKKSKEHRILQKKTKSLLNGDQKKNVLIAHEENTQFTITSERKLFVKRLEKSFAEAKTCEMIFPAAGLHFTLFHFFQVLKMALREGAKIRIITEATQCASTSKKLEILKKNPFFEIKLASSPINFGIILFDNKQVNMCISSNLAEVPSLGTNNQQFVEAAKMMFKVMWSNDQERNMRNLETLTQLEELQKSNIQNQQLKQIS